MKPVWPLVFFCLFASSIAPAQPRSWELLNGTMNQFVMNVAVTRTGTIFGSFNVGMIYRSLDGGESWTKVWDSTVNTIVYALAVDSSGSVYAATSTLERVTDVNAYYVGRVIRSSDEGATWESADKGIERIVMNDLLVDGKSRLYAGTYGGKVYRSTDSGMSWRLIRNDASTAYVHCLGLDRQGNILTGDSRGHLMESRDSGSTWSDIVNIGQSIESLAPGNGDTVFAGAWDDFHVDGGVYRISCESKTWEKIGLQSASVVSLLRRDTMLLAGTRDDGVFSQTHGETTWVPCSNGLSNKSVWALTTGPHGELLAGTGNGLFRSPSSLDSIFAFYPLHVGDKWEYEWERHISTPPLDLYNQTTEVLNDTVMSNGSHYFHVRTVYSYSALSSDSYQRVDTADGYVHTWSQSDHMTGINIRSSARYVDTVFGVRVEARSTGYIEMTCDLAYGFGVVVQREYGAGWPDRSRIIYARVNGSEFGTPLAVISPPPVPSHFELHQNYPNPFNPSTTIRYGLPARSYVKLMVFNTLGQQVAILQNGEQEAGEHEVRFDGKDLPSSVYFYRMQTGSFTEAKKLVLVR